MPLLFFAFFVLVQLIIYYRYPRRGNSDPSELVKEKKVPLVIVPEVSIRKFNRDTETMYLQRSRERIIPLIERMRLGYTEVEDNGWFVMVDLYCDNSITDLVLIKPIHGQWLKRMIFEVKFATLKIPDHKLVAAAELVNRINNELTFNGFGLDYNNQVVSFSTTLLVGDREIESGQIKFHINHMRTAKNIIPFIERIINTYEEPEVLAREYLSPANNKI
jgi:hypothetical protein